MAYTEALDLQHALVAARNDGRLKQDVLLIVEHPPVFTLGRRGGRENLCVSESFLARQKVAVVQAERGGNITYHGPGQLVAYPIVDLERRRMGVADYVTLLEEAMIRTAADWGVSARRDRVNRGVWMGDKKLGSIGVAVRRGVSFHGLALNVDPSMEHFSWITPCGLAGVAMTSLRQESGSDNLSMAKAGQALARHMADLFDVEMEEIGVEALLRIVNS
ncbi:MAG: lipoyl(octanoyl) transferase LipB [Desulfobacterales bacterium]|nr:lipoyl(octanoyl) transferase LipB [Desulfobacterales bacterium]